MISTRVLKDQIEQLNEQNQSITDELRGIKEMLNNQSESMDNPSNNENNNNTPSNNNQSVSENKQANSNTNQNSTGNQAQNQNQTQKNENSGIPNIANDLAQLKDMTNQLETKMKDYISNNSSGSALKEEDVVNLILTMMNGMIDWTTDLLSKQNKGSNQPT